MRCRVLKRSAANRLWKTKRRARNNANKIRATIVKKTKKKEPRAAFTYQIFLSPIPISPNNKFISGIKKELKKKEWKSQGGGQEQTHYIYSRTPAHHIYIRTTKNTENKATRARARENERNSKSRLQPARSSIRRVKIQSIDLSGQTHMWERERRSARSGERVFFSRGDFRNTHTLLSRIARPHPLSLACSDPHYTRARARARVPNRKSACYAAAAAAVCICTERRVTKIVLRTDGRTSEESPRVRGAARTYIYIFYATSSSSCFALCRRRMQACIHTYMPRLRNYWLSFFARPRESRDARLFYFAWSKCGNELWRSVLFSVVDLDSFRTEVYTECVC